MFRSACWCVGGLIVGVVAAVPGGACGRLPVRASVPAGCGAVGVLVALSPSDLRMISPAEHDAAGNMGGGLAVCCWAWMPPGNNGDVTEYFMIRIDITRTKEYTVTVRS